LFIGIPSSSTLNEDTAPALTTTAEAATIVVSDFIIINISIVGGRRPDSVVAVFYSVFSTSLVAQRVSGIVWGFWKIAKEVEAT